MPTKSPQSQELAPTASQTPATLFDREDYLRTLLAAAEDGVPEELEQELQADIVSAARAAKEKRDRVAAFLADLMVKAGEAAGAAQAMQSEVDRLRMREKRLLAAADRVRGYVLDVIRAIGPDAKGKLQPLEGHTATLKAQKVQASVEVTDEAAVPLQYKRATVILPAEDWLELLSRAEQYNAIQGLPAVPPPSVVFSTLKADLAKTLKGTQTCPACAGLLEACEACGNTGEVPATVPGAQLVNDKLRLVVC